MSLKEPEGQVSLDVVSWCFLGIQETRTSPLHTQSNDLVERSSRTLTEQLAILNADHQRDWNGRLPLILIAYWSAVQDSTACAPVLLMLGRELQTPAELTSGVPLETPAVVPGLGHARKNCRTGWNLHTPLPGTSRQSRHSPKEELCRTTTGRHFNAGELVCVSSPKKINRDCGSHHVWPLSDPAAFQCYILLSTFHLYLSH